MVNANVINIVANVEDLIVANVVEGASAGPSA